MLNTYEDSLFVLYSRCFTLDNKSVAVDGAAYDNNGKLILDSIRPSDYAGVKHIAEP